MPKRPLVRAAPWLILLVAAYAFGRWQGSSRSSEAVEPRVSETPEQEPAAPEETGEADEGVASEPSRSELLIAQLETIATAAKTMSVPDAKTYSFFENLTVEDMPAITGAISRMVPGNEQDVMFIMAIRRWAELDGAAALERASQFPALGTRSNAILTAYEAWGANDAEAAVARAEATEDDEFRSRALSSVLTGASTMDPTKAIELWQACPTSFRESSAGSNTIAQIASGAYGTGKGEEIRTIVDGLPEGELRTQLVDTLAAEWGSHYPNEAYEWVHSVVADDEAREAAVNGIFSALVQKDPALAAIWAEDYPDEGRRTSYIAAAVQSWARLDAVAAETWVNEQPSGRYLDGAGYAMAAHYMARHDMQRSFSWIRRINMVEMRAELLGTLGRMWASDSPTEFKRFLDETSLNRAEVEMLLAKIPPAS